jgi:hypothetical protein
MEVTEIILAKFSRLCQPVDLKNLKKKIREPAVSILLPNVCDFQKENHTLW